MTNKTVKTLSLYCCDTKLTACYGETVRDRESRKPIKVTTETLMENYGEIGKALDNLYCNDLAADVVRDVLGDANAVVAPLSYPS